MPIDILGFYLQVCFFVFFFGGGGAPLRVVCGILVPQPGTEPGPTAVGAQSPHHWTAREVPGLFLTSGDSRICLPGRQEVHLRWATDGSPQLACITFLVMDHRVGALHPSEWYSVACPGWGSNLKEKDLLASGFATGKGVVNISSTLGYRISEENLSMKFPPRTSYGEVRW